MRQFSVTDPFHFSQIDVMQMNIELFSLRPSRNSSTGGFWERFGTTKVLFVLSLKDQNALENFGNAS